MTYFLPILIRWKAEDYYVVISCMLDGVRLKIRTMAIKEEEKRMMRNGTWYEVFLKKKEKLLVHPSFVTDCVLQSTYFIMGP